METNLPIIISKSFSEEDIQENKEFMEKLSSLINQELIETIKKVNELFLLPIDIKSVHGADY